MMVPMALNQLSVCVVFWISSSLATPIPLFNPEEGSTGEDDIITFFNTTGLFNESQITTVDPTPETDFLTKVADFLEENMLLILVVSAFTILVFLIICGAIVMSRRRKVNAYYPSSFPSKMYVDDRDKMGGAKLFNEVPERSAPEQEVEAVDSHKQLQADIMRAARSLRTPSKCVDYSEGSDHRPEDGGSKLDGSILDQQLLLPSLPEEKEPRDLSDSEEASAGEMSSPETSRPEQPHPDKDGSQEPLIGRSVRPSSLHIHNDSATLQLIAGEKTAF